MYMYVQIERIVVFNADNMDIAANCRLRYRAIKRSQYRHRCSQYRYRWKTQAIQTKKENAVNIETEEKRSQYRERRQKLIDVVCG